MRCHFHIGFAEIVLVDGIVFEDCATVQVLDSPIGAAEEDSAIEMAVGAVLVHEGQALPAAAPLTFEADVDVVGHVLADLACADVGAHLT
jgi:hypothetical protein